jgi:cyclopropane-fatty-acyl-phospholipid synthase
VSTILPLSDGGITPSHAQRTVEALLAKADIRLGNQRPWDIDVHNDRFFSRVLRGGSLAFGESYMDGWWDSRAVDQLIERIFKSDLTRVAHRGLFARLYKLATLLGNEGRIANAFRVGKTHYDLGNDLFEAMLDQRMIYSCGYWSGNPRARTLDQAQEAKLDLVCRKMQLLPGMRILEIGSGWGGFAKFAAERYGVSVVSITVSREQYEYARELCRGLPIEFRLQDYREVTGNYDRVISIAMFENVFYKNYETFFSTVRRVLDDSGLFLLHTFGNNRSVTHADPWFHRYIFKTGMVPSLTQVGRSIEHQFVLEDLHNFGADYDPTLMAWHRNFVNAWPQLRSKYGDRFFRMWTYYLLSLAGAFRARHTQLWQLVLSPRGVPHGYTAVR